VRVVLVDFGERHRHTYRRAALHRSRPPADQSGKRVASWTGKSPDTPDTHDLLRTSPRGCYEENGPVEFKLYPPVQRSHRCRWLSFLARDVIYTSRAYATMTVSVCLSVTEVNWRIIATLGFKLRSKFTAHCRHGEGSSQQQHLALC